MNDRANRRWKGKKHTMPLTPKPQQIVAIVPFNHHTDHFSALSQHSCAITHSLSKTRNGPKRIQKIEDHAMPTDKRQKAESEGENSRRNLSGIHNE